MQHALVPILGFAAYSGVGKTTLLSQIIPLLKQKGLRIGLIKHGHHNFDVDVPGKDSYRLRQAGASPVMIVSKYRRAMITEISSELEPRLGDQLKLFDQSELDLVLVEGFKSESFPKIELHRAGLNHPLLYLNDTNIIAIASDCDLDMPSTLVRLDINQPEQVAAFILTRFIKNHA
ncbi:Molybdopterin-guanine dinucleotide biosynthesis adapter protein [Crenothrix polyspora]|uniref:Molybdopterin-guanine dinucleotide biosynthesis adapter protein n=1 Tax=Crenothrix polyspora TaxID=360316 RepID=A0A1R4HHI9_9GAMM|nr:molybdopterin-guanine dinucleotide biosynthesis protein B [Crenothrix polyspora]SJM95687.1 Molybdopterin-guanine dinucleotide biosynthesis adapter protein [Crenothrix polyspora]